jgi:demethylmenaquinone methyltransferase/2-methoxy-6-polyprenyl-1,4-benzoquinol methylase
MSVSGTTPQGATSEQDASRWVRGMFGRIAGRYDLLNHVLSFNMDRRWRARLVDRVADVLDRPAGRVLDLCCGTADVLVSLQRRRGRATILGSDFCHPMLLEARRKTQSPLFEADALALPLAVASLDLITIAFGFRNLANYRRGLEELLRVLKPGGVAAILEFSQPKNRVFGAIYQLFSTRVLPWIGGMVSGSREAYVYLPESIRKFPRADELAAQMRAAGYVRVELERMAFGAVALHRAWKRSA